MAFVPPTRAHEWFVPVGQPAGDGPPVYAFPAAGGGSTAFLSLADRLAPDWTVRGLNLPGRDARFLEPIRTDLYPLVDELTAAVAGHSDAVLFGHCSGSLLAYLVARRLKAGTGSGPAALVVASFPAPDRFVPSTDLYRLDSAAFWREVLAYGGVPAALVAEPDFREVFEGAIRGDHLLLAGYAHAPGPPLDVPLTVLYGADDPVFGAADAEGWRAYTKSTFRTVAVPSDHWMLAQAPEAVAEALRGAVHRDRPGSGQPGGKDVPVATQVHRVPAIQRPTDLLP